MRRAILFFIISFLSIFPIFLEESIYNDWVKLCDLLEKSELLEESKLEDLTDASTTLSETEIPLQNPEIAAVQKSILKSLSKNEAEDSMYLSPGIVNQAMELGAAAYVSKNADESELLEAWKTVSNGETYTEKNLLNNLYSFKSVFITLTKREKQVFNYGSFQKPQFLEVTLKMRYPRCVSNA